MEPERHIECTKPGACSSNNYMSVPEMAKLLGLKKTDSYWLVHKNLFKVKTVKERMFIDVASFEKWYAGQTRYKKITGEAPGKKLGKSSYSIREVSAMLEVSEQIVYAIIRRDKLEIIKADGLTRIPHDVFRKWYKGQSRYRTVEDRVADEAMEERSISMPEMAGLLGITRSGVYSILKKDKDKDLLETVVIADKKLITRKSFEKWFAVQTRYTLNKEVLPEQLAHEENEIIALHRVNRQPLSKKKSGGGNDKYLTREEAALLANVTASAIGVWYSKGEFPVKKYGKVIRIPRREFEQYLEKKKERKDHGIDT